LQEAKGYCSGGVFGGDQEWCNKGSWNNWTNVYELIITPLNVYGTNVSGHKFRIQSGILQEAKGYCSGGVFGGDQEWCNKGSWSNWTNVNEVVYSSINTMSTLSSGGKFKLQSTCPNGSVLENNQCKTSVIKCPNGYTETTGAEVAKGECKGNIDYSYYEYKCNEE
ncbi:hypothetical protein ACOL23_12220, partial [Aliarcobacter butzleri]